MSENENAKPSVLQGVIITIVILVVCALLVVLMTVLNIPMWIPFLGLTSIAATGASFELRGITKIWASAAVALLIGFAVCHIADYGIPAICVAAGGIILMIFGMCSKRMEFIFNSYTAIFLTAGTAAGVVIELIPAVKSLVFGYAVLGLLPCAILKLRAKKQA